MELMNTQFDNADVKIKKYANKLYEILASPGSNVNQNVISVICE